MQVAAMKWKENAFHDFSRSRRNPLSIYEYFSSLFMNFPITIVIIREFPYNIFILIVIADAAPGFASVFSLNSHSLADLLS